MKIPFGKPFPGIDSVSLKDGVASGLVNGFINETGVDVESIPGQALFTTLETTIETLGIGTARHFNGISNNMSTINSFETYTNMTWYSWLLRDAITVTGNCLAGRSYQLDNGWGIYVDGSNNLVFRHDLMTGVISCPDLTGWKFVAITYTGSTGVIRFYSGSTAATITEIGQDSITAGTIFEIGFAGIHFGNISGPMGSVGFSGIPAWNGYIDQPGLYNWVLTLPELQAACMPESRVMPGGVKVIADIVGLDPEPDLFNGNSPDFLYLQGTTVLTGLGVGAANAAPLGPSTVEVGKVDGLYETLAGVVLAVSNGHVFTVNADGTYTAFTGDVLNVDISPYFCEDGQNVFISHWTSSGTGSGKIARVDVPNKTVELLNQNSPSHVTHICRSKGYLLCNGDDVLITSSLFDVAQVFGNSSSLEAVVVLADNPRWIVATAQGFTTAGSGAAIYLSKDNGITWAKRYTDLNNVFIQGLEYMGNGMVLAGTGTSTGGIGKILRSTDSGETWNEVATLGSSTYVHFIKKLTTNIVIAGTGNGPGLGRLFRSIDYGQTWTDIGIAFGEQVTAGEALTAAGDFVAVAVLDGANVVTVWRSTNTATTFTVLGQAFPDTDYVPFIQRITDTISIMSNGFITTPSDKKIWRSTDAGESWFELWSIPGLSDHAMPFASCVLADGSVLIGTAGDGIGTGGAQIWKSIDDGFTFFLVSVLDDSPFAAIAPYGLKETHITGTVIATGRIGLEEDGKTPAAKWQTAVGKNAPQGDVFFSEDIGNQYEALDSWERFNAQSVPDSCNGVFTHRGLVYSSGPRSIEMNYSSGDAEFPWAVSDPALPFGLLAPFSWVSWDELDTIMYLTSTDRGIKVVQLRGRQQQGISEEYDQVLNDRTVVTQPQDAKAWGITIRGLRFYVISFQEDNLTLIYNLTQDHWARWAYWNGTSYEAALINAYCYSTEQKRHFFGDRRPTGKIFTMDLTDLTDDGQPIVFEYTSGHVSRGADVAKFPARYLGRYKRGYSIDNTIPEVLLSWRDDGRAPFKTERVLNLGETGDNEFYVHANRLGMYRLRQWRQRSFLSKCRLIFSGADES